MHYAGPPDVFIVVWALWHGAYPVEVVCVSWMYHGITTPCVLSTLSLHSSNRHTTVYILPEIHMPYESLILHTHNKFNGEFHHCLNDRPLGSSYKPSVGIKHMLCLQHYNILFYWLRTYASLWSTSVNQKMLQSTSCGYRHASHRDVMCVGVYASTIQRENVSTFDAQRELWLLLYD